MVRSREASFPQIEGASFGALIATVASKSTAVAVALAVAVIAYLKKHTSTPPVSTLTPPWMAANWKRTWATLIPGRGPEVHAGPGVCCLGPCDAPCPRPPCCGERANAPMLASLSTAAAAP